MMLIPGPLRCRSARIETNAKQIAPARAPLVQVQPGSCDFFVAHRMISGLFEPCIVRRVGSCAWCLYQRVECFWCLLARSLFREACELVTPVHPGLFGGYVSSRVGRKAHAYVPSAVALTAARKENAASECCGAARSSVEVPYNVVW